jgi:isopenicillin N synthase-like dioxygenase
LQIINHGVPDESLSNMKEQVQGFFDLPLQEKKRWAQKPGSLEGYGQVFVISEEQKLEWNDMIFLKSIRPLQDRNLNFWPENPPEFR